MVREEMCPIYGLTTSSGHLNPRIITPSHIGLSCLQHKVGPMKIILYNSHIVTFVKYVNEILLVCNEFTKGCKIVVNG